MKIGLPKYVWILTKIFHVHMNLAKDLYFAGVPIRLKHIFVYTNYHNPFAPVINEEKKLRT